VFPVFIGGSGQGVFLNAAELTTNGASGKNLAMLFSGGLDTTIEAAERVRTHEKIHLLTFQNGCCVNMAGARRRSEELKRIFGEKRFTFEEVDTRHVRKSLAEHLKNAPDLVRSPLNFDLACKMAAIIELILFSKRLGVVDVTDGASAEQDEIFIQHEDFLAHIKPIFSEYGLNYLKPLRFDQSRSEKVSALAAQGLKEGTRALEHMFISSNILHQPFCLRGAVTFFFTSPLRKLPPINRRSLPIKNAIEAWDYLLPFARAYLDERIASKALQG